MTKFIAGELYLSVDRAVSVDAEPGAAPGPLEAVEAPLEGFRLNDEPVRRQKGMEADAETEAHAEPGRLWISRYGA